MVLASAFMISTDVLSRKLFDHPIGASSELSGYVLAIGTAWALTFTLLNRAHVRIDSLYSVLPTRLCALLDIIALVSFMVFAAFITWQAGKVLANSIDVNAHSVTPLATLLAIPQTLWVAGLVQFSAVLLLLFVRAVMLLVRGRWQDVQRLLGPRTAQQELAEALREQERYKG